MNREEAIIILTNTASLLRDGTRYMKPEHEKQFREAYEMAIKALERPEQRWIPCERELPKVGEDVLLSVGGMYTAEGCLREDGDWTQFRWDAIIRKDMVGAWCKLPEPYRGEQK